MSDVAAVQPVGGRMSAVAERRRSERQLWAAPGSSHDRLIGVLRWLLPVMIGVLAAFLVMAPLTSGGDVSFVLDKNKVEVAHERLKLQAATYRGEDRKGQPFALTAGSAVQKTSAEPIVRMNDLAARIRLEDGPAHLTAPSGTYNMDNEQVKIAGPIAYRAADGYSMDASNATLDLQSRTLQSSSPVQGKVPQGTFSGDRMHADLDNRTVTLDGHVHLRIVPGK